MQPHERFLNYIRIDTKSDDTTGTHPSFPGEFDLAKMLMSELKDMGIEDVSIDDKCYLFAHIPATEGYEDCPALGFISHMDTAPDYSGTDVKPVIHEDYDGKDVVYPNGMTMRKKDFPHLAGLKGETLITSDGTTLLGADDKAGVAEIMTAIEKLINEKRPHGPISVAFTPDEEIGQGADFFDVDRFGAKYAYTVDGGDVCEIEYENFNAADAFVEFFGVSVHPGSAKNVMKNAINIAHEFHGMLPEQERPEHTEGYEGFCHLTKINGTCGNAKLRYIVRDHDRQKFEQKKAYLEKCAGRINEKYGKGTAVLTLKDSYYNMIEMIKPHMHLIETAKKAISDAGQKSVEVPVRGGTDGARLSYMGLPCPNLGTGGFNFHGPYEHITAERMEMATMVILNIIGYYSETKASNAGFSL